MAIAADFDKVFTVGAGILHIIEIREKFLLTVKENVVISF